MQEIKTKMERGQTDRRRNFKSKNDCIRIGTFGKKNSIFMSYETPEKAKRNRISNE